MGQSSSNEPLSIQTQEWDVIIIGGGSAGCVLANRLSADGKSRVLLAEAGESSLKVLLSTLPGGYGQLFHNKKYDYDYYSVPQKGCHGRKMYQPRGKMLGGSRFGLRLSLLTIVPSMRKCVPHGELVNGRYHRGAASDYDRWAKLINDPSWSYESLLPLFRKSEGFEDTTFESEYITHDPSEKYHGRDGEWKVSYQTYFHKCSSFFIRATEHIGMKFNPDFNAESTLGVGRIQTFVDAKDTARSNTEKAFLNATVRARPNLSVVTGATCLRVVVENGKCTGAIILYQGEELFIRANRQVIISCGAFDSPRILASSNIPLPGIGKNLQDHLGINVSFKLPDTIDKSIQTIDSYNGLINKYLVLFKYLLYKTGPAASNIGEAVAFYRTELQHILQNDPSSGPESPHVELIALPLLTHHHEGQQSLVRTRPDFNWTQFDWNGRYITIVPLLLNPYSRGELRFKDGGMGIDPNYLSDQRDLDVLIEGVKMIRKIVKEGYPNVGFEGLEEVMPGKHVKTDQGIGVYVRDNAETYYHPVGTCKMGLGSDPMAVVSPRLQVHGVENLRVVDASVMPVIVAGHTCAPTVVIAEKAAEMILEDLAKAI